MVTRYFTYGFGAWARTGAASARSSARRRVAQRDGRRWRADDKSIGSG
jgi:hypothetical protein